MDTKKTELILILLIAGLGFHCTKKEINCPKFGYEFTYDKPGARYSPGLDSFMLGNEIIMEATVPKTFFENTKGYNVTLDQNSIKGNIGFKKITNIPGIPIDVAADDFEFSSIEGQIFKDTVNHTEGQLKGIRTLLWTSTLDSFKVKVIIKPNAKGIFILSLGQQGNRDSDCALYKHFISVTNSNQHLYLLEPLYGYIPTDERAYCFKVY